MTITDIKNRLNDPSIRFVLALSQYQPTPEKVAAHAAAYLTDPDVFAFACFDQDNPFGVLVIKNHGAQAFEILSIAVVSDSRHRGIGSKLITYAAEALRCTQITAETDDDAVGFYRRYGFKIKSLGEKYPNCVRYLCTLNL